MLATQTSNRLSNESDARNPSQMQVLLLLYPSLNHIIILPPSGYMVVKTAFHSSSIHKHYRFPAPSKWKANKKGLCVCECVCDYCFGRSWIVNRNQADFTNE